MYGNTDVTLVKYMSKHNQMKHLLHLLLPRCARTKSVKLYTYPIYFIGTYGRCMCICATNKVTGINYVIMSAVHIFLAIPMMITIHNCIGIIGQQAKSAQN